MQFALPVFVCRGNGDESRCLRFESQQQGTRRSVLSEMAQWVLTDHGHGSVCLFVHCSHCEHALIASSLKERSSRNCPEEHSA